MEARLVVCALSVSIDQRSNSLSLFNIVEDLNVPAFPFAIPYMALAIMLTKTADEPSEPRNVSLHCHLEGEQLFRGVLAPNFQQHLRVRLVVDIQALVVPRPGLLRVSAYEDDRELGAWQISVNNVGPAAVLNPGS